MWEKSKADSSRIQDVSEAFDLLNAKTAKRCAAPGFYLHSYSRREVKPFRQAERTGTSNNLSRERCLSAVCSGSLIFVLLHCKPQTASYKHLVKVNLQKGIHLVYKNILIDFLGEEYFADF